MIIFDRLSRNRAEGYIFLAAFAMCIPLANWLITHVGTTCPANGPCLVPVAPGILAPSGVLMIGLALVFRDLVQRRLGLKWAAAAVVFGAIVSSLIAPASLAVASGIAFLISEFADLAVYTPLQKRHFVLAVMASSFVGLVVDSAAFLYLAFGSLNYIDGQIIGKAWMVLLTLPAIRWLRQRDQRLGIQAA